MDLELRGEKRLRSGRVLKRKWDLYDLDSSKSTYEEIRANTVEVQTALYCEYLRKIFCKKGQDRTGEYWRRIKEFEEDVFAHIEDGWELKWTTG